MAGRMWAVERRRHDQTAQPADRFGSLPTSAGVTYRAEAGPSVSAAGFGFNPGARLARS